ncbi:AAA family ATPase [Dactylosporangium sp. NPDC005555]|uniref:AAA family ATPase n=1 Tax=Dactylosporangium sp. NPDC005555 TaxID=3154889 RepID=UPI0033B81864
MGGQDYRDQWAKRLDPDVVEELMRWQRSTGVELVPRGWFDDGRSASPVALVTRSGGDDSAHRLVLKFCSSDDRANRLADAWNASPDDFRTRHIAPMFRNPVYLGKVCGVFFKVATGNLLTIQALNKSLNRKEFHVYCERIMHSIIRDWNLGSVRPAGTSPTVGQFVLDIIGHRIDAVRSWGERTGELIGGEPQPLRSPDVGPAVNPFTLLSGPPARRLLEDVIVGHAHGDLSGRNILLPTQPAVDPDRYVLIDADHFATDGPLARDPMHLLVALALDWIDMHQLSVGGCRELIEVIVDPDSRAATATAGPFQRISAAIHESSGRMATDGSFGGQWTEQCLLSLVGVGLVHIGRDLKSSDPAATRRWCYELSAAAAQAYLDVVRKYDNLEVTFIRSADPSDGYGRSPTLPTTKSPADGMLNHEAEHAELRARLSGATGGVVIVSGPAGVGKSLLVNTVLAEFERGATARTMPRILHSEILAGARFDVRKMIDDIAGGREPAAAIRYGSSLAARLQATLEAVADAPVIVVIDSAERLLRPDGREFLDLDLDEALDVIARTPGHRVSVVLVTQTVPISPFAATWPTEPPPIHLSRLPYEHFVTILGVPQQPGAPGWLPMERLVDLYRLCSGNPRLAELFHATATLTRHGPAGALATTLMSLPSDEVRERLPRMLVHGLDLIPRMVVAALAAYATPVTAADAARLLEDRWTADQIDRALHDLLSHRVIRRTRDGRSYHVQPADVDWMLEDLDRDRLLARAADELSNMTAPDPRRVDDLMLHFAELQALLRAADGELAYALIEKLGHLLRAWGSERLLLAQREAVRGTIGDDYAEMENLNELGDLYKSRGWFPKASEAFGRALQYAGAVGDAANRTRIQVNLAAMYWQNGNTSQAAGYYDLARSAAQTAGDALTWMSATAGLADCYRRWGRYDDALQLAQAALGVRSIPADSDSPDDDARELTVRTVTIGLKRARWHAEIGEMAAANDAIIAAEVAGAALPSMRALCFDGRADLLLQVALGVGAIAVVPVLAVATEAIDLAIGLEDSTTVLQARTTLAVAHIMSGASGDAVAREVEHAVRYRPKGRSLIVLALQALVARQHGPGDQSQKCFDQLYDEAKARLDADSLDFAAWDFLGYAICGRMLDDTIPLTPAEAAFAKARDLTDRPTSGLIGRLRVLVRALDVVAARPGRLRPILDLLDQGGTRRSGQ